MYEVLLHPTAWKELQNLEDAVRSRIVEALWELKLKPTHTGKQLKGSKYWSLRIGDHRAIYEVSENPRRVIVLFIGHRSEVYDDFSRAI
jgi:mRNA interferase RelE/StbE